MYFVGIKRDRPTLGIVLSLSGKIKPGVKNNLPIQNVKVWCTLVFSSLS